MSQKLSHNAHALSNNGNSITASSLIAKLKRIVKFIKRQHIEPWKWNLLDVVEMAVFGDDIVGTSGNCTVHKLVVVFIDGKEDENGNMIRDIWYWGVGQWH